jgi:GNAT superfamily N-acetyltransferase
MLLERQVAEPIVNISPPAGVEVRLLQPGDAEAYAAFRPDRGRAECARRLGEGQWCIAAWYRRRIVSAAWGAAGRAQIDYLDREIFLAPDEVYSYDLFTLPGFRGSGMTSATRIPHIELLRDRGYRRALATSAAHNEPARALQDRLGYRSIGWIGYVGLGPWRHHFCRVSPAARGLANAPAGSDRR